MTNIKLFSDIPEKQRYVLGLFFLAVGVLSAAGITHYLKNHFLVAFAVMALYFLGGFRFMPWRTPLARSFSLGIFVGACLGVGMAVRLVFHQVV